MTEITEIPQDSGAATRRIHNSMLSKELGGWMAVREALLTLLACQPMYGFQLHTELTARLPHRRGLNVGQSYTTLDRAQKSGLVATAGATEDGLPLFELTPAGRARVTEWLSVASTTSPSVEESTDRVLLTASLGSQLPSRFGTLERLIASEHAAWQLVAAERAHASPLEAAELELQRVQASAVETWLRGIAAEPAEHFVLEVSAARPRRGRPRQTHSSQLSVASETLTE